MWGGVDSLPGIIPHPQTGGQIMAKVLKCYWSGSNAKGKILNYRPGDVPDPEILKQLEKTNPEFLTESKAAQSPRDKQVRRDKIKNK